MARPFIVLGDRTSHGGTVVSADFTTSINGKYLARVGDMTVCPRCKGQFPITEGASTMTAMGQAPARDGDKTACGASLIAAQGTTTWSTKSDSGAAAAAATSEDLAAASALVAKEAPTICLECLQKAAANAAALVVRN